MFLSYLVCRFKLFMNKLGAQPFFDLKEIKTKQNHLQSTSFFFIFNNHHFNFSLTKSPVSYSGSVRSPYGPRSPCSTSGHGPSSNPYTHPHQYGLNNNNHGSTTATTFTHGFRLIFFSSFYSIKIISLFH